MMTDYRTEQGVSDLLKQHWKRALNEIDNAIVGMTFMCLFDDIRQKIKNLIHPDTHDDIYSPRFLHLSVVLPCFNMGLVLSRKKPYTGKILDWYKSDSEQWRRHNVAVVKQYFALAFMFACPLMEDVLLCFWKKSEKTLRKSIKIDQFLPKGMKNEKGNEIMLCEYGNFTINTNPMKPKKNSRIVLIARQNNKASVLLKLLPLLLMDMGYDQPNVDHASAETFGKSSVAIKQLYPKSFWSNCPKPSEALQKKGRQQVMIYDAIRPSVWWNDVLTKKNLFGDDYDFDGAFMALAMCHTKLNCFDEIFHDLVNVILGSTPTKPTTPTPKKAPPNSPSPSTAKESNTKSSQQPATKKKKRRSPRTMQEEQNEEPTTKPAASKHSSPRSTPRKEIHGTAPRPDDVSELTGSHAPPESPRIPRKKSPAVARRTTGSDTETEIDFQNSPPLGKVPRKSSASGDKRRSSEQRTDDSKTQVRILHRIQLFFVFSLLITVICRRRKSAKLPLQCWKKLMSSLQLQLEKRCEKD